MKDFDFPSETNEFLIKWYLTYGEGFGPTYSFRMPEYLANTYTVSRCRSTYHLRVCGVMQSIETARLETDKSRLSTQGVEYVKKLIQERIGEQDGD